MSTNPAPVPDPRLRDGDVHDGLVRDASGRWFTGWGLWALNDEHIVALLESQGDPFNLLGELA